MIADHTTISRCLVAIIVLSLASPLTLGAERITYHHLDAIGSPVGTTNNRWYTGHPEDAETALLYTGARYYDPTIGRFYAVDPIAFTEKDPHSFNRYAYANNNPYKFVDPDGRWATYVHQASISRVLSFLPSGDLATLRAQQAAIDANQANNVQFQHSMRVPGQDAQQAWEAGNSFVCTELQAARELEKAGKHEQALQRLGNAMHTMQDATSPSHRGFQEWDSEGSYMAKVNHVRREMFDPGAGSELDAATIRAWQLFRSREPLPKEILPRP